MKYLLVIDLYTGSILKAVKSLRQETEYEDLAIAVLTRNPQEYASVKDNEVPIKIFGCDFYDATSLETTLKPLIPDTIGVICRGDKQIQFLRRVVPYLPKQVLAASQASLLAATDKAHMRQYFAKADPDITPKFVQISLPIHAAIKKVEDAMAYPVIVKPTNLVSSLLIQSCHNREELQVALEHIFEHIHEVYAREERAEGLSVIVEEFLEGDFYSIDCYVLNEQDVFYCPPVAYIPAQQLGIDDFFLYKRFVPVDLSQKDREVANQVCQKAISALGLTYSSIHVELVNTASGWKVIEVGPRLGRFRNTMYKHAYNIDHSMNDVLIHLGHPPVIPSKLVKYCAAYSIYPSKEGILEEIAGISQLSKNSAVSALKVFAKPGDICRYAKHGGKALAEFVVAEGTKSDFGALTNFIEHKVHAKIRVK